MKVYSGTPRSEVLRRGLFPPKPRSQKECKQRRSSIERGSSIHARLIRNTKTRPEKGSFSHRSVSIATEGLKKANELEWEACHWFTCRRAAGFGKAPTEAK